MKSTERDKLAVEHAQSVGRLADVFERREAERRAERLAAERNLLFPEPKRVLAGARGALMMLRVFPGMAGLFTTTVPESHLLSVVGRDLQLWQLVRCTCGAGTVLGDRDPRVVGARSSGVDSCSGGCGRAFLLGKRAVFVHRFGREDWDD